MKDLLLGVDIGTSSVKGLICDSHGRILSHADAPNQPHSPQIGWAEQSVEIWQENTIQVIRSCLGQSDLQANRIAAIGISGIVPALVLLDQKGVVLRPAIQYNDARARSQIAHFREKIGADCFFEITGASLSAQSLGPKWAWLLQNEPETCRKAAAIMGSYDAINHYLTGYQAVERNWALEGGLYDLGEATWSAMLLEQFEIPPGLLPPILHPTDFYGGIRSEIARMTGLQAGTPVFGGSADHVAAAQAAGVNHPGDVLIKFGSSGDILYCSDVLLLDPRLYLDFHNIPGKYLPNGCMASSGTLLNWVVEQFCETDLLAAKKTGRNVFEDLNQKAGQISPGSAGIVILPYFLGAKTPLNDTSARGTIFGLTLSHNRYHIYRAVMEAVTFGFRHHFEVLESLGQPIRRVVASEGGARSTLWRQIAADVLQLPIGYLQDNPGSALGAAMAAGMGAGLLASWDQFEKTYPLGEQMFPQPDAVSVYEKSYSIYRSLYPRLKNLMHAQGE